jgi:hypothetical protein
MQVDTASLLGRSAMAGQPLVDDTYGLNAEQNHAHDEVDDEDVGSDLDLTHNESRSQIDPLDSFLKPLVLDEGVLYNLARRFSEVYQHLALTSDQQFLPTPVTRLPTGEEVGRYLAIDVGGSNLRVAFIELLGEDADSDKGATGASGRSRDTIRKAQRQRVRRTLEKAWPIQEHLKKDKADDLFSWIGDCIAEVVADSLTSDATKGEVPAELEMGITFSFPIMYVFNLPFDVKVVVVEWAVCAGRLLVDADIKQARIGLGGHFDANGQGICDLVRSQSP